MSDNNSLDFEMLFNQLGVTDLPAEERKEIENQITEAIDDAVIARLAELMSEEELTRFVELNGEEAEAFLKKKNIDIGNIAIEETVRITGDWAVHMENVNKIANSQSASQE